MEKQNSSNSGLIFKVLLVLGSAILIARLGELQVVKGNYFQSLAEENRVRRVPIYSTRGEIHARGGQILVGNKKELHKLTFDKTSGFSFTKENGLDESSDNVYSFWRRDYTLGSKFGHLSGYLGEVNEDEVGKINPDCSEKGVMNSGKLVGRTGLEEHYECKLSGVDGEDLFEIDSSGNIVRKLGTKPAVDGENLITNIDYQLQEIVSDAMGGKIGAVVATDVNGEILALFSSPSFDPNAFVGGDGEKIQGYFEDKQKPFFDRAIGGAYHPGSIFKPLVAISALQEGAIERDFEYEDKGKITVETPFGDFTYNNWYFTQYGGVEGKIGLTRALARSTDTFFYKVGEMLGADNIAGWAEKFGLGKPTGVDIPGEVSGLVPTAKWKKEVKGENWFLGNTYHYSIGQGDLTVTPISINSAISAVVTGKLCSPKIVGETECTDLGLDRQNMKELLEGMEGACSTGGTANVFFDFPVKVACKTGTAETGVGDETHAWFTVVAPTVKVDSPDIIGESDTLVMTVLIEKGGEGSQVAAPVAKEILNRWFNR